jgi:hypothetical protein
VSLRDLEVYAFFAFTIRVLPEGTPDSNIDTAQREMLRIDCAHLEVPKDEDIPLHGEPNGFRLRPARKASFHVGLD